MTLTLAPETQRMVEEKLKDGTFRSFDEIVHAGLSASNPLPFDGLDEETLDAIDEAEDQIERGEVHELKDVEGQIRQMFNRK